MNDISNGVGAKQTAVSAALTVLLGVAPVFFFAHHVYKDILDRVSGLDRQQSAHTVELRHCRSEINRLRAAIASAEGISIDPDKVRDAELQERIDDLERRLDSNG